MAILGYDGVLQLRREPPSPVVVTLAGLADVANAFWVETDGYWTGDEVRLTSPVGLPLGPDAIPSGSAIYAGGRFEVGDNRRHVASDNDKFWLAANEDAPGPPDGDPVAGDGAWFYLNGDPLTSASFFVYIDQLGRVSFYNTRREAFYGETRNRVELFPIDFKFLVISPSGTDDYDNAIAECTERLGTYLLPDAVKAGTLESICDFAPTYDQPVAGTADYDNAEIRPRTRIDAQFPWEYTCQMKAWTLETNGDAIDTSTLGNRWGQNVKSLVTGGGSVDFMADRIYESDDSRDSTALMQLVLLTEKGAKAEARFFLIANRQGDPCSPALPGDLYYEAELLVTNIAISVRPDELVTGTARFVTTGPISLRQGPN